MRGREEVNEGETLCGNRSRQLLPSVLSTGVPSGLLCLNCTFQSAASSWAVGLWVFWYFLRATVVATWNAHPSFVCRWRHCGGNIQCIVENLGPQVSSLNLYSPVAAICTASLTFSNSTFCPHSVFMCFVWFWEQTAIISLNSFNWLVFITEI